MAIGREEKHTHCNQIKIRLRKRETAGGRYLIARPGAVVAIYQIWQSNIATRNNSLTCYYIKLSIKIKMETFKCNGRGDRKSIPVIRRARGSTREVQSLPFASPREHPTRKLKYNNHRFISLGSIRNNGTERRFSRRRRMITQQ